MLGSEPPSMDINPYAPILCVMSSNPLGSLGTELFYILTAVSCNQSYFSLAPVKLEQTEHKGRPNRF